MTSSRSLRAVAPRLKTAAIAVIALLVAFGSRDGANARTPDDFETTQSLVGSYLAGRFARTDHETDRAAKFYRSALYRDPDSEILIEQGFLMEASEGNWGAALDLAKRLAEKQPKHRMAQLALGLEAFREGRYDAARQSFKAAGTGPIGELTSVIAQAWTFRAEGQTDRAISSLKLRRQADWAQFYLSYHHALIADQAGRTSEARNAYEKIFKQDSRTLRTALAYTRHAAKNGDMRRAKAVLRTHLRNSQSEGGEGHPLARDLLRRLNLGERPGLLVATPAEGLAEVFYGLGEALTGEGGVSIGILYLQMALLLDPKQPFALAALANAHESTKRYAEAIETYERIPDGTPLQTAIDIRKAFNLNSLDQVDEAKVLLEKVAASGGSELKALDALGNIMRSRKRYAEAVEYYSRIISEIREPQERDWVYYYSRGTSYERLGKWPEAEVDLKQALKLSPDQPLTLNYLGYSWIDQNRNLRQGLKLIEKAVALKPDDGYIVDSLGWAHYKLGNFDKAVTYLERAVELRPEDPVLNDHLGDAYWRVGRMREARFQWDQALSLQPEPQDIEKIKKKLAEGLPMKLQARATQATASDSGVASAPSREDDGAGGVPLPTRRGAE